MSKHLLRERHCSPSAKAHTTQFNDNALRLTRSLSEAAGLTRLGCTWSLLNLGVTHHHHYHDADEEFIFIVSGEATAKIGDERFTVRAGDFMGFGPLHRTVCTITLMSILSILWAVNRQPWTWSLP